MLNRISRLVSSSGILHISDNAPGFVHGLHRRFSLISIHSSFPASLLRLQSQERSNLYDFHSRHGREDDISDDAVMVSKDTLVYPYLSTNIPYSNGATLMPNTFMMQEIIRTFYDQYIEGVENGNSLETPLIYRIPKDTPIPSTLILLHEHSSRFSLQPSHPISINDLNNKLDEFYSEYAEKKTAEQWLDENDFVSAVADDAQAEWMGR